MCPPPPSTFCITVPTTPKHISCIFGINSCMQSALDTHTHRHINIYGFPVCMYDEERRTPSTLPHFALPLKWEKELLWAPIEAPCRKRFSKNQLPFPNPFLTLPLCLFSGVESLQILVGRKQLYAHTHAFARLYLAVMGHPTAAVKNFHNR